MLPERRCELRPAVGWRVWADPRRVRTSREVRGCGCCAVWRVRAWVFPLRVQDSRRTDGRVGVRQVGVSASSVWALVVLWLWLVCGVFSRDFE